MKRVINYPKKILWLIYFFFFIIVELVMSNFKVAYYVLMPSVKFKPGVVGIPIRGDTDKEITVLANIISITPGTLSLDVSTDKKFIFVHSMFSANKPALIKSIKDKLERPILEIMR